MTLRSLVVAALAASFLAVTPSSPFAATPAPQLVTGPSLSLVASTAGPPGLTDAPAVAASRPRPQSPSPIDAALFAEMRWRAIGPLRGGRTKAAAGVPDQPHVFYVGVNNGGVWKTTDAGRTWVPIFDDQPTGSIGSIAVAPSDPNVIYVGSGEGLHRPDLSVGDGIYKSTDAGETWTHLGLRDGQQIPQVAVDPRDPDRMFAAVLGHPYGPNEERGIFRTTDGGRTFEKVLYVDENTGGNDVDIDPSNPDIVYATLWEEREGPWENASWAGTGGGIFKSTDGGTTWRELTNGLPTAEEGGVQQANMAIAPSDPQRLFAIVAANRVGIFRSDDAGENWVRITEDTRPAGRIGGGDISMPLFNPQNADEVIITSTVSWKSVDGGRTFAPFRGAPGGDDYQNGWINPNNPDIMVFAADQGAVVTLNGGDTWSSWYNQSTAQLYHVNADNDFPYRVCSGQQESGSGCVSSRGNDGQITVREWHPVGVSEYGYAVPDPLNANLVYGGRITRYDRRTGQVSSVSPRVGRGGGGPDIFRQVRTMPVVFSTVDPQVLFFSTNVLWKTLDGGINWQQISPDLTRETWEQPDSIGKYREEPSAQPSRRGVIYTVAPSNFDISRIWVGTDDGLIHITDDGGLTWKDVTPPQLTPWAKVSIMDAGRFDNDTAYAAINTLRLDDMRPHIYRTHDGGETWTEITNGIPDGGPVNVVREDPQRQGLLFAGTEREVYVSFDDGDHWQSLRLNMAASSVRDLIVKDDDLVAATHGRGFWILDDITPLRQIDEATVARDVVLFEPQSAYRVRWNMNTDTPLPPDEPSGPNPPDGAVINYYLKSPTSSPVTLEVFHPDGRLVRRYSSDDPVTVPDPATAPVPLYWYRPPQVLSAEAGMHRFVWDLYYQPLGGAGGSTRLPIAAIGYNTVPRTGTPFVAPGEYTVRLTVDGRAYDQTLTVKMDPRVQTPHVQLQQVFTLSREIYYGVVDSQVALTQLRALREQASRLRSRAGEGPVAQMLTDFDRKAQALEGAPATGGGRGGRGGRGGGGGGAAPDTLAGAGSALSSLMTSLQGADVAPTTVTLNAIRSARANAAGVMARWDELRTTDLEALNASLRDAGLPPIRLPETED